MISPDAFTTLGTQWVDAITTVAIRFCSQFGLIVAAAFGLAALVQKGSSQLKAQVDSMSARQDRQSARIDGVVAAQPPLGMVAVPASAVTVAPIAGSISPLPVIPLATPATPPANDPKL
jgi:hypothetical protein